MNQLFTIFRVLTLLVVFSGTVLAQPIFTEDFESGTASPDWGLYWADEENVMAVEMNQAPAPLASGGNYVGHLQDIDGSFTGAALAVAGETTLQNYTIEGDVYCYVNYPGASAYTGLAFYADSAIGTYIKMVVDFDADQRIRLYNNHLDFITFMYTFEHSFTADDIPGGIPTEDGWHHMKVEVSTINADTTAFWCYFDGELLDGCPIYDTGDDRMSSGQFGLFSFQQDDTDGIPGYFDNIIVNPPVTSVEDYQNNGTIPHEFGLAQNYPNPFNPETQISYQLSTGGFTSLSIFDLLGREVNTLVFENQPSGYYTVSWNGKNKFGNLVPSGIYLYTLKTGSFVESKKMVLIK